MRGPVGVEDSRAMRISVPLASAGSRSRGFRRPAYLRRSSADAWVFDAAAEALRLGMHLRIAITLRWCWPINRRGPDPTGQAQTCCSGRGKLGFCRLDRIVLVVQPAEAGQARLPDPNPPPTKSASVTSWTEPARMGCPIQRADVALRPVNLCCRGQITVFAGFHQPNQNPDGIPQSRRHVTRFALLGGPFHAES